MHDAVFVAGSVAAVIALVAAIRTVREREPLWRLTSGYQFGLMGMMILLVISNAAHSATLDLIDIVYALGFIAYALYAWNIQKRFMAAHQSEVSAPRAVLGSHAALRSRRRSASDGQRLGRCCRAVVGGVLVVRAPV